MAFFPARDKFKLGQLIPKIDNAAMSPEKFIDLGLSEDSHVKHCKNRKWALMFSNHTKIKITAEEFLEYRLKNLDEIGQKPFAGRSPAEGYVIVGYHAAVNPHFEIEIGNRQSAFMQTESANNQSSFRQPGDIVYVYECIRIRPWWHHLLLNSFTHETVFISPGATGWDQLEVTAHDTPPPAELMKLGRC
jgi:hypothetical protein